MIKIKGHVFDEICPINKGASGDEKYRVKTPDGCFMLLRVSDIKDSGRKRTMYEMMGKIAELGVPMSLPIAFGTCNDNKSVYQLLSWCKGDTADVVIPKLSEPEQYKLGIKAGKILNLIHTLPAIDGLVNWSERYIGKSDERVESFFKSGVEIKGSELLASYYNENKRLLRDRPQCFNHGDYHLNNLMVYDNEISVIDWDLFDDNLYGDPWYEFNRILYATVFPHFATGFLRGYFNGEPPEKFWPLLLFYFSSGVLQLVLWAVYVQPKCLDECKQTLSEVLRWYDGMRNIVPSWYIAPPDPGSTPETSAVPAGGSFMPL